MVTLRRARPGQAAALADTAVRLFGALDRNDPVRLRLRIFQGRYRPDLLLTVTDWASREAAGRYLAAGPIPGALDTLSVGLAESSFYHELSVHDHAAGPAAVATCTRIHCRRAAVPAVLSYLIEAAGPRVCAQPGLVVHALYQDEDRPNYFLALRGWASEAAMEASQQGLAPALDAELRARGATLAHFRGRTLLDLARPESRGARPPSGSGGGRRG